jgi:hypothetical protein
MPNPLRHSRTTAADERQCRWMKVCQRTRVPVGVAPPPKSDHSIATFYWQELDMEGAMCTFVHHHKDPLP